MQVFQGVTTLPWAMKPIIGLMSDIFPMCGYNKAPYMAITSALGVLCFLLVGVTSASSMPVNLLVICFILIQMQASTADLLSEAKYAEKIRHVPDQGPNLLTYVWLGMQIGSLMAVIFSGVIIGRFGPRAVYVIAVLPAAAIIVPLWYNYLEEERQSKEEQDEAWARFMGQGETIVLCGIMLFGTISLTLVGLTAEGNTTLIAVVAIIVAIVTLISFSVLLSPTIAKFNAFSLIQTSLSLQISGAAFYFYTDGPKAYPEGPHFSPFFYNSVIGMVSSIVSLFGLFCYQRYMTTWKYRTLLIIANLAFSIICIPDIIMFARLNLVIGIPDHMFMVGSAAAQSIINQWMWMPQVVILANLCPKGMEATMFALLAGAHNIGNTIGANCGALLLHMLDCTPSGQDGESDKFANLWKASAISSALPLLTIMLLFWLIPDARQDEAILDGSGSATEGSLWRRWTGQDSS